MAFVATELTLSDEERAALERIVAAPTSEQRMVQWTCPAISNSVMRTSKPILPRTCEGCSTSAGSLPTRSLSSGSPNRPHSSRVAPAIVTSSGAAEQSEIGRDGSPPGIG